MVAMRWMATAALLVATVAGCTSTPDYQKPEMVLPGAFQAKSAPTVPMPLSRWWQGFGSPELNALEEAALTNNRDLQAAISRIAAASALAGVAESPLLPLIQGVGAIENRAPKGGGLSSTNSGSSSSSSSTGNETTYQLGLQASYEIDLWGKNRSTADSALATAQASIFDREVVAMTLTADVATAYFQYLGSQDRLEVAQRNAENVQKVLAIAIKRVEVGEGRPLEVAQQRSSVAQAQTVIPVLALQRDQAANRLALLVGRAPEALHLKATTLAGLKAPVVEPGLPSELLRRRPDIRRVDAALFGANEDIGTAKAQLLPSFALTGRYGVGSTVLSSLISPGSVIYSIAANVAQTLFDNGKIASEIAYSEAHFRELVQAYQKAVLTALQDVDNALAATRWSAEQEKAQNRSVAFSRKSRELAEQAYRSGSADYFSVLDADRVRYTEEDKLVQARQSRLTASVDLFKALGGGFDAADVPALQEKKARSATPAATPDSASPGQESFR